MLMMMMLMMMMRLMMMMMMMLRMMKMMMLMMMMMVMMMMLVMTFFFFLSHAPQLIHSLLNNLFVAEKASSQLYAPLELNALMRNALIRTQNDKKLMTQPPLPPQQPPAHFL